MIAARFRTPLRLSLALHAAIGTAVVNGLSFLERAQDDLFTICVLSMWLAACLLPFGVTAR